MSLATIILLITIVSSVMSQERDGIHCETNDDCWFTNDECVPINKICAQKEEVKRCNLKYEGIPCLEDQHCIKHKNSECADGCCGGKTLSNP